MIYVHVPRKTSTFLDMLQMYLPWGTHTSHGNNNDMFQRAFICFVSSALVIFHSSNVSMMGLTILSFTRRENGGLGKLGFAQRNLCSERLGWSLEPNSSKSQVGSSVESNFVLSGTRNRKANWNTLKQSRVALVHIMERPDRAGFRVGSVQVLTVSMQFFLLCALYAAAFDLQLAFLTAAKWWSVAIGAVCFWVYP